MRARGLGDFLEVMAESIDPVRKILPMLAEQRGMSLRELSMAIGKNEAYLSQFLDAKKASPKKLPEDVRERLAEKLGVPDDVLRMGATKAMRAIQGGKDARVVEHDGSLTIAGEAYLKIPVYDIRASAGAGALVEDGEPTAQQVFREQFLRRITRAKVASLSVIQVAGDSMWETLHDGDAVLVDRSIRRIVKDGIYILQFEGELLVKRCQRDLADGSVIVKSDNPRYEPFRVTEVDRLDVLGRVIWIGRVLG